MWPRLKVCKSSITMTSHDFTKKFSTKNNDVMGVALFADTWRVASEAVYSHYNSMKKLPDKIMCTCMAYGQCWIFVALVCLHLVLA